MNETIVNNWNYVVKSDDDVYILGDIFLNDNEKGLELFNSLAGKKHIVFGNHDTDTRRELLQQCLNVVETADALRVNYDGYHFFLTHYPCHTCGLEIESLKQCLLNLYGHTHQKSNFFQDIPMMYHVGVDSHSCTPVSIDKIILDMENKVQECLKQL